MRKLYLFFLILSLSFFLKNLHATHALGGDLMYVQIGPNQFEVTLRIYRDCNGIALNNQADIYWQGSCGSGSSTANRTSNIDITPLCPGLPTACQGGSGSIGIEEHIYTTTISLPSGCTDVTFDYTLCCRNHVITTLIDPGNENIYLSTSHFAANTMMNNSPVFNNYPAPIVCVNQPVIYNHGVYDPDGDSLYFSPLNCYEANNDTVEYLGGYNGVTPLTTANPIEIHPNTGAITFVPTIQQVGVMCILVEEFRNGVKIGETLRDIQFNVIACANIPPVASGINNVPGVDSLNFVISVCENNQICFDLSFSDPDNDNLSVSWNHEIPSASFQVFNNGTVSPTGEFCWLPQASDIGLSYFSINIIDDACPLVGSSTYTYTVEVLPNPNSMSLDYTDLVCNDGNGFISLNTSSTPDSVYWASSPSLTVVNDTFVNVSPAVAESFSVEAFFPGSCTVSDSVAIGIHTPPSIYGTANTSKLCNGGTVILNGFGGTSYSWNNGVMDNVAFTPPVGVTDYIVTGVDSNSCTNTDTLQITVNPLIGINATPGGVLCVGDSLTLSGFGAQTYAWNHGVLDGVAFMPPVGTTTYILTGTDLNGCTATDSIDIYVNPLPVLSVIASNDSVCLGDSISLRASGANQYVWSNGINNGDFIVPAPGLNTIDVIGTDTFGCENSTNIDLFAHDLPTINIVSSNNNVCEGDSIALTALGASNYSWSHGIGNGQYFYPRIGTDTFTVIGTDQNSCSSINSVAITSLPPPSVMASTSGNDLCEGDSIRLTGSGAQSYTWSNGVVDGVGFYPPVGNTWYKLTGTDQHGCSSTDSIEIKVHANPIVSASSSNNNICESNSIVLSASGASIYSWDNGVIQGQSFVPSLGTTVYTVFGTDSFGCTDSDTISIHVNPTPNILITASDTEICEGINITLTASGASLYTWTNGIVNGQSFMPSTGLSTYLVNALDANGCSVQDSVEIMVHSLPSVTANANHNQVCDGQGLILAGSGAQTYVWNNGVVNNQSFVPSPGTQVYIVTGMDANACINTDTISITTHSLPTIALSSSNTTVCEDEPVTLTGSGAQTYVWNNGVTNGVSFVPPVGLTNYVLCGYDANGCVAHDSIQVLVHPNPNVGINPSATTICEGQDVSLTGTGAQTYSWSHGIINGQAFVPLLAQNSYTLTGTNSYGCKGKDSIDLTINPIPDVQVMTSPNIICNGNPVTLTASGAHTYQWTNGVVNNIPFIPSLGLNTYEVTATDINGCERTLSTTIMVNPLPDIGANSSDNNVCEGASVTLLGSGAQSYEWDHNVSQGIPFTPELGLTTYQVVGTNTHGCQDSASIDIQVFPLPNVIADANDDILCEGGSTNLTAQGATTYTWSNGIANGDTIMPSLGTTTYYVVGEDINGCIARDTIVVQVLENGILSEIPDAMVCDISSHSLSSHSSFIDTYQWGVIVDGVATDLSDNMMYQGTNTQELNMIDVEAGVHEFYLEMEGLCGNELSDTVELTVHESTPFDELQDTTLCIHEANVLFADVPGNNIVWNDGTQGQQFSPTSSGLYYVSFQEPYTGCEVSDSLFVEMEDCIDNCVVVLPSGFSPNSDGVNDIFRTVNTCDEGFSYYSLTIYDRWGGLVYKTDSADEGWDGSKQGSKSALGVYVYNLSYTKEFSNETEYVKGNVTLVH